MYYFWKGKLSLAALAVLPWPMRKHQRDRMEKVDWVTRAAGDRQTDRQTDARLYPVERHHLMPFGSQISPHPGSIFRSPVNQREAMPRERGEQ